MGVLPSEEYICILVSRFYSKKVENYARRELFAITAEKLSHLARSSVRQHKWDICCDILSKEEPSSSLNGKVVEQCVILCGLGHTIREVNPQPNRPVMIL